MHPFTIFLGDRFIDRGAFRCYNASIPKGTKILMKLELII